MVIKFWSWQKPAQDDRQVRSGRVPAAEFKATCLELMDRVRETGAEFIVTKHGTPVAKLVPVQGAWTEPTRILWIDEGNPSGYERPFDPIDGEYDINRD